MLDRGRELSTNDVIETVVLLDMKGISDFRKHPFQVREDEEFLDMLDSVKKHGITNPVIVRAKDNGHEMIAGHRRKLANLMAGEEKIPAIIRELTDDEAIITMVISNKQRENVLPSEKAFAYKMYLEAENRQGQRNDLTYSHGGNKLEYGKTSAEIIGEGIGESKSSMYRYVRLTKLIPQLLQMVDEKVINNTGIAITTGVELSYLTKHEQTILLDNIELCEATPSVAQAIEMKELSKGGELTDEKIEDIMAQEKANQIPKIKINEERLMKVLPNSMVMQSPQRIEEFILKCIEDFNRRQKNKSFAR